MSVLPHECCPPLELAWTKRGNKHTTPTIPPPQSSPPRPTTNIYWRQNTKEASEGTGDSSWRTSQVVLEHQDLSKTDPIQGLIRAEFDVLVIIATANRIRGWEICREYFSQAFQIPEAWWQWYCKSSNGYFGFEETEDDSGNTNGYNSWAYFETKFYYCDSNTYLWHKLNVFIRWIPEIKKTILIVFDPPPQIREKLPSPMITVPTHAKIGDPFWIYEGLLEEVLHLQDQSVWMIRDQVRAIEKNRAFVAFPNPDYSHLHGIARHAIHVTESLEVTVQTVGSILHRHADYVASATNTEKSPVRTSKHLRDRLLLLETMLVSLKHRSASNQARLQNEIQLSFNIVAQSDARTSEEIVRAAQRDSAAMKTVAFLTLTFLPATFISAVFSTSFFNFDAVEGAWAVSDKIWIYWAVLISVTSVTILLWYLWHRVFPPTLVGHRRASPIRKSPSGL